MAQNFIEFRRTMARLEAQLKKEEAERKARKEAKVKNKKKQNIMEKHMAKQKEFTEEELELFESIYAYAVNNHMSIGSVEGVTRSVVKALKDIAFVNEN